MKTKSTHTGWFRCRIRGLSKKDYLWTYFHVTVIGPKVKLRREARFLSGLYLHRQIFDFEPVIVRPEKLVSVQRISSTTFYYENAIAAVPALQVAHE